MSARFATVVAALGLVFTLSACALKLHVAPAQLPSGRTPESTVDVNIVSDGRAGCRKESVLPLYGRNDTDVTWNITNNCEVSGTPRRVTIRIEDFKIKHKTFGAGQPPFTKNPAPVDIEPKATQTVTAHVLASAPAEDYKGLNVYRYKIKIKVENGPTNNDDPEIVIDWP